MTQESIYANLPTAVEFLRMEDMGEECDAHCPHCGALGRYIYYFRCSDGKVYGAMKGCYRHFPKNWMEKYSRKVKENLHEVIEQKDKTGKVVNVIVNDYPPNAKEAAILNAAAALAAGEITDVEAKKIVRRNYTRYMERDIKKDFGTYAAD